MATTEPKAISMMIMAPRIPAPSLGPGAAVMTLPIGPAAERDDDSPDRSNDLATSMTLVTAALGTVAVVLGRTARPRRRCDRSAEI